MRPKILSLILSSSAAVLLFASLKLPVWQMRMEAPQYQDEEALDVKVYPTALRGDLDEIKVLNSYIGVHIPEELPQTKWLPKVLIGGAALGLLAAFFPRRTRKLALLLIPAGIALALIVAAIQAQWQMYQIGHERDEKTRLVGVKDFTTPLLGRTKIAQFTITSYLSWGALLIGGGLALQWWAAWVNREQTSPKPEGGDPDASAGLIHSAPDRPPA
jgi:hypothetical protein